MFLALSLKQGTATLIKYMQLDIVWETTDLFHTKNVCSSWVIYKFCIWDNCV